jgi:HEPN domain
MKRSFFPIAWLFQRAREFEKAYHAVPETPPFSWPRYFLLCHSIELALKAFLTLHGESESDLRLKFGHDLKKLLKRAKALGLKLEPDTEDAIKRLARAHREHWARYPNEDIRLVYGIEQFEKNAAELLEQVRAAIYPSF